MNLHTDTTKYTFRDMASKEVQYPIITFQGFRVIFETENYIPEVFQTHGVWFSFFWCRHTPWVRFPWAVSDRTPRKQQRPPTPWEVERWTVRRTENITKTQKLDGGNSKIFYVHPEFWGNDPNWLSHIFQTGWFNHQLEKEAGGSLPFPPFFDRVFTVNLRGGNYWIWGGIRF